MSYPSKSSAQSSDSFHMEFHETCPRYSKIKHHSELGSTLKLLQYIEEELMKMMMEKNPQFFELVNISEF